MTQDLEQQYDAMKTEFEKYKSQKESEVNQRKQNNEQILSQIGQELNKIE